MEEYRPISDYENEYQVSKVSNVRRTKKKKNLAKGSNGDGYSNVRLYKNGILRSFLLNYEHKAHPAAMVDTFSAEPNQLICARPSECDVR